MSTLASLLFAVTFISGVSPELHTFNREGECGTGAVVPWAGSLWSLSYAPHMPCGSRALLYELKPDFSRVIHRDVSLGEKRRRILRKARDKDGKRKGCRPYKHARNCLRYSIFRAHDRTYKEHPQPSIKVDLRYSVYR